MIPGFALLGSHLGDPERKLLSPPQLRLLTERMQLLQGAQPGRELEAEDLRALGYGGEMADRILALLSERDRLEAYLDRGRQAGCFSLTRGDENYPLLVRRRLGGECPGCFFYKGDPKLLEGPAIALVGSRELRQENEAFAREAGRQAALHGVTLVSGNARGADRTAQQACLAAGGQVISVVADCLLEKQPHPRILYLSQEDYDAPFSAQRALSRNRIIHCLGYMTLVAQCTLGTGGTWSGTTRNLEKGYSMVICFRDGSEASLELQKRGAYLMDIQGLSGLTDIRETQTSLFDR